MPLFFNNIWCTSVSYTHLDVYKRQEVNKGVQNLQIFGQSEISNNLLENPMNSIKNVIEEILNPEIDFVENVKQSR